MPTARQPGRSRSRPRAAAARASGCTGSGPQLIRFDPRRRCFCAGGRALVGVHETLNRLYGVPTRVTGAFDDQFNLQRGNSVAPGLTRWLEAGATREAIATCGMGPWAGLVAKQCLDLGWAARRVELPVGHAGLGIGTAADLFCVDAQGRGVLVEVKVTGNANWSDYATKTLKLRVDERGTEIEVGYTFRLRAFLQVMMTKLLFQKTFPTTEVGAAVVMRLVRTGPGQVGIVVLHAPDWLDAVAKYDMIPRMLGILPPKRVPGAALVAELDPTV